MSLFNRLFGKKVKQNSKTIDKKVIPAKPANNCNIPRKELTQESSDRLRMTMNSVISKMMEDSCPCKYPRFIELVTFFHGNYNVGPVFCADTNYLIHQATSHPEYLKEIERITENPLGDYPDSIYECQKCSSTFKHVTPQYSINFEFEYMIVENLKHSNHIGTPIQNPFPVMQGFYGFEDRDIINSTRNFKIASSEEVYNYLTEKA